MNGFLPTRGTIMLDQYVEDQESFDALRELGVDFIQGFIVERPHPLGRFH